MWNYWKKKKIILLEKRVPAYIKSNCMKWPSIKVWKMDNAEEYKSKF